MEKIVVHPSIRPSVLRLFPIRDARETFSREFRPPSPSLFLSATGNSADLPVAVAIHPLTVFLPGYKDSFGNSQADLSSLKSVIFKGTPSSEE